MRINLSIAAVALILAGTAVPAFAQSTGTTTTNGYGQPTYSQGYQPTTTYYQAPVYNTNSGGGTPYYNTTNGVTPVYNNGSNVQPLSMNQMIAGKNSPSYTYNSQGQQPYTFGAGNNNGVLTADQAAMLRQQRDANAFSQQQQYYSQLQQQRQIQDQAMMGSVASRYQGSQFNQLYSNNFQQQPQVVTKKRVVYNERNNPLTEPPRLFNPDQ